MARSRILWIVFFLLVAAEASACPVCTHDRLFAENWHIKYVVINLLVPLMVVANRLDVVRSLYVLIPYVFFAFQFHSYLLWKTYPATAVFAQVACWVWGLNLVGVALLYAISPVKFLRWKKEKGLAAWQPIAYGLLMLLLSMAIAR